MASRMQPRPHQEACLRRVVAGNTIVNMPTGTGKTLVAVLAIDHFRDTGKAIFLVPTRPLVTQQADYVRRHCGWSVAVAELQGAKTDHLSAADWKDYVVCNDVLVGTAEVFRRALVDTKFLKLSDFSLLIFDECHNATGNSPMAAILRDVVHRCAGRGPRILGLTASFVHGSLKDIEKKRKDLEGLLQARIFCPEVEERPMDFDRVLYINSVLPEMERVVEDKVEALVGLAQECGVPLKETKSVIRRGVHVFSELGVSAFIYFLRECVAPQIQVHLEQLVEVLPSASRDGPRQAMHHVARLRQVMQDAAERLASSGALTGFPNVTDKATRLLDLVRQIQQAGGNTRVIIFCEQTVLAHPLAHLVQHHTKCKTGTCTGVGSMTDGQRKQALQSFRAGDVPLLTCTAALEEGLDVSECEVVVRFSSFKTTKSHIQGAGRARAWNARVYYFDNDPHREIAGAELLERTAKASELSLTREELVERRAHTDVAGVHPYRTSSGAEISIFNCVQLVYEFAARTMGQSFRPEESMLKYTQEIVCEFPLQRRQKLVTATVPSPDGFFDVHADKVNDWWGSVDLDDVAEKGRMKNWDGTDKELRRFMYVVAVELSRRGFLDDNNQPSARALRDTRHQCEAWKMSPGVRVGVKYDARGLEVSGQASPSSRGYGGCGGGGAGPPGLLGAAAAVDSANATGASRQVLEAAAPAPLQNFKGRLNEVTHGSASYTTSEEGGRFRATVTLSDGRSFSGAALAQTKKVAEQLAAEAALRGCEAAFSSAPQPCPPVAVPSPVTASVAKQSDVPRSTPPVAALAPWTPQKDTQVNHKGRLNELTRGQASYTTVPVAGGGFLATVTLPTGARVEARTSALNKKDAEQLAAETALSLEQGGAMEEEALPLVLGALAEAEVVALLDLVRTCGLPRATVNRQLYELQKRGLARRVVESPPVWSIVK